MEGTTIRRRYLGSWYNCLTASLVCYQPQEGTVKWSQSQFLYDFDWWGLEEGLVEGWLLVINF